MCIAIVKPAKKTVPKDRLEICYHNNPDGAGFAYINDRNKLVIRKGFFKFSTFWKAYEREVGERRALIHFRITTVGKTCQRNCHPWNVGKNTAMVHNGTIRDIPPEDGLSDSGTLAKWLKAMNNDKWTSFMCKSGQKVLESLVKPSRVAFMNHNGFTLLNQKDWKEDGGVWYSNDGYKIRKYKANAHTSGAQSGAAWWDQYNQSSSPAYSGPPPAKNTSNGPPVHRHMPKASDILGYTNCQVHSRQDRIRHMLPKNIEYNPEIMRCLEGGRYAYSAQKEPYMAYRAMLGDMIYPKSGNSTAFHELTDEQKAELRKKAVKLLVFYLGESLMHSAGRSVTVKERSIIEELYLVDLLWCLKSRGHFKDLPFFTAREEPKKSENKSPVTKTPQGGAPKAQRMGLGRAKELLEMDNLYNNHA